MQPPLGWLPGMSSGMEELKIAAGADGRADGPRVFLVGCSAQKLHVSVPIAARELYQSQLFTKALAYAEREGDEVFILSARHGLVELDRKLLPYEWTMRDVGGDAERRGWAGGVCFRLAVHHEFAGLPVELVLLAGEAYAGPVREKAKIYGWSVQEPLKGLMVGRRLQWLTKALGSP